jgi:hypothetical protein
MAQFLKDWQPWLISAGILIGAVIVARIVHVIVFAAGRRIAARSGGETFHQAGARDPAPVGIVLVAPRHVLAA